MRIDPEIRNTLIAEALQARQTAYAPYSHYQVGAALLTASGNIYRGINIENAAYPTSMCAERVAVYKAVSEGEKQFTAIAVATSNGGFPCGSCRQVLAEFGLEIVIIVINQAGEILAENSLSELLPGAFVPGYLGS